MVNNEKFHTRIRAQHGVKRTPYQNPKGYYF